MTWEELVKKAKKIGFRVDKTIKQDVRNHFMIYTKDGLVLFYEDCYSNQKTIGTKRTPDQMWAIMEALK